MASAWEAIQEIASVTRNLKDLGDRMTRIEGRLDRHQEYTAEQVRRLSSELATLHAAQDTVRETVRAEIALAVADLRVRYAEEQARRQRPPLEEGSRDDG
jgi:predicted transposase YdaD